MKKLAIPALLLIFILAGCGTNEPYKPYEPDIFSHEHLPHPIIFTAINDVDLRTAPREDAGSFGTIPQGMWVEAHRHYDSGWYFVTANSASYFGAELVDWLGYLPACELEPLVYPVLWQPREVYLSEFGRQVAAEFLSQFESLFVPLVHHLGDERMAWVDGELKDVSGMPHFAQISMADEDWRIAVFDHLGNEVTDAPFVNEFGLIAHNFRFFDLNYDGIPEIEIIFAAETWGGGVLYKFVNGEYARVVTQPEFSVERHNFLYDTQGKMGIIATGEGGFMSGFYHLTFIGNEMHLEYSFTPKYFFSWEMQGLARIEYIESWR
ncbi:MAG: hypothetical protein FWB74_02950 [Defluviitaleaceae bacterium]|nr:hypothetical protein [Defluviitaleaceae bacterium]